MSKDNSISVEAITQQVGVLVPALLPVFNADPVWGAIFAIIYGFFPALMQLKQERINEVAKFIQEHPEEFRKEIVQSEEFQEGFLVFFEQYLKSRIKIKRDILKKIFLGYTTAEDKEHYELERLNDCLVRITIPSLEFLAFLKKEIIPILEAQIEEELKQETYKKSDRSKEWWHDQLMVQHSIWTLIDKWIHDELSPENQKVKEEYGIKNNEGWIPDLQHRAETREKDKRDQIRESTSELVTLGIFDLRIGGGTWGGGGGKDYSLTTFGIKFLSHISMEESFYLLQIPSLFFFASS